MLAFVYLLTILVAVHSCEECVTGELRQERPKRDCASALKGALIDVIAGNPELRMQPAEPIITEMLEGNFATLHYMNFENSITGVSNCTVENFTLSVDGDVFKVQINCPKFLLYSPNEVTGHFIDQLMYGQGEVEIEYNNYEMAVYGELRYTRDFYGRPYCQIGKYTLNANAIGPLKYEFRGLYNGDRAKNEAITQFANENWRACSFFSTDPVCYAIMDGVFNRFNNYLRSRPIDTMC